MITLFCAILWAFAAITNADVIETKYFQIHHVFDELDFERFNREIVPKVDPFVDKWIEAGIPTLESKTRIYIQPSESMNKEDALQRLYGNAFFSDFAALENASKGNASEFIRQVRIFAINYPPSFRKVLDREADVDGLKKFIGRIREGFSSTQPFSLYGDGACHISFKYYDKNASNVILLGKSTDSEVEHPYFRLDTVFHEIGHEFFSPMFAEGRDNAASKESRSSLNEMFADVVAASFLNDPCRTRDRSGNCRRNLSRHNEVLSSHLWTHADPHERNESVAHLMWEILKTVGFESFSRAFIDGVTNVLPTYPKQGKEFSRRQVNRDTFLHQGLGYINDYDLLAGVAMRVCDGVHTSIGPCRDLSETYLGNADENFSVANNYITNSPTMIKDIPRSVAYGNERASIWFANTESDDEPIVAHFSSEETTDAFTFESSVLDGGDYWDMKFVSQDGTKELIWHYPGTVEIISRTGF